MGIGLSEQKEKGPLNSPRDSYKFIKQKKHRKERKKAKQDPECQATYKKYKGYEY